MSTERDNDVSKVSRPAVLRFATTAGAESTLRATDEWNLAADFPGSVPTPDSRVSPGCRTPG